MCVFPFLLQLCTSFIISTPTFSNILPQVQLFSSVHLHTSFQRWGWLRNIRDTLGSFCCPRSLNILHRWAADRHSGKKQNTDCLGYIFHLFQLFLFHHSLSLSLTIKCLPLHLPLHKTCSDACALWNWSSHGSLCTSASLYPSSWRFSKNKNHKKTTGRYVKVLQQVKRKQHPIACFVFLFILLLKSVTKSCLSQSAR